MDWTDGTWQLKPDEWLIDNSGAIVKSISIDSYWCKYCAYAEAYDKSGNLLLSGLAQAG